MKNPNLKLTSVAEISSQRKGDRNKESVVRLSSTLQFMVRIWDFMLSILGSNWKDVVTFVFKQTFLTTELRKKWKEER